MLTKRKARQLARKIAESLFMSGFGGQANRLVLEMTNGKDGGGWGLSGAAGDVFRVLVSELKLDKPKRGA